MWRKLHLPELNPVLMDLALVIATSLMMSVVFVSAGYMIYIRLAVP